MHDVRAALHAGSQQAGVVAHVTLDQLALGFFQRKSIGVRAVKCDDLVPATSQLRREVRPEQPRPTCQIDAHPGSPWRPQPAARKASAALIRLSVMAE